MNRLEDATAVQGHLQPAVTVVGAAWRYRWLVASAIVAFAVLSLVASVVLPPLYVGKTSVLLDETSIDLLGAPQIGPQDRAVLNQLEVFKSAIVAIRAAELARDEGVDIDLERLTAEIEIAAVRDTDVITVSFASRDEDEATIVTASVLQAYQEVRREQRLQETNEIVAQLDSARTLLEANLTGIRTQIDQTLSERGLAGQLRNVLDELVAAENQLQSELDEDARAELLVRRAELDARLRTLDLAVDIEAAADELTSLIRRRDEVLAQLATLATRQSEVELELQAEGSGLAFIDPSTVTRSRGTAGPVFLLTAGAFLGLLLGLGLAYSLASRRATFGDRTEPESLLQINLLADIPEFRPDQSRLPVLEDPRSPVAEAFRFAASNLELALRRESGKTVAFVSSDVGDGKTTLLANTALAAARSGKKVLVIDADFGNQGTTELLLKDLPLTPGLTELVAGYTSLAEATTEVKVPGQGQIEVLSRGTLPSVAPDFFSQPRAITAFQNISTLYDLVLIDSPPILNVAYASSVAQLAGHAVAVIAHDSGMNKAIELVNRCEFIGVPPVGYLYNRAPFRVEMLESGGSMKDVLGDRGFTAPVKPRSG